MRSLALGMTVLGLLFAQACASEQARTTAAAAPATKSSAATNADILLAKIKADKKLLVASNMDLTEAEAAKFWPLYDAYQKNLELINHRLGRTIMDYADALKKGPLSDDTASKLLDESLTVEESDVALKQAFAEQLVQILPEAKAARYLQIETKIRSLLRFDLAREIPLAY